jgi:hypothetical protein
MRASWLAFCNSQRKRVSFAETPLRWKGVASKRPATASGCGGSAALATPPTPFFSSLLEAVDEHRAVLPSEDVLPDLDDQIRAHTQDVPIEGA